MPLGKVWRHTEDWQDQRNLRDLDLCRRIAEVLELHYPGHFFKVEVDSRPNVGCAYISIPLLQGNFPYVLHLSRLKGDPMMRAVVKAGGEILERFGVPRSRIDPATFQAVLRRHPIEPRRIAPNELR